MENKNMTRTFCGSKSSKARQKEAYNNKWIVLKQYSLKSRVGVNENFPGTFVDFRLKIFSQEIIDTYDDPCP